MVVKKAQGQKKDARMDDEKRAGEITRIRPVSLWTSYPLALFPPLPPPRLPYNWR